MLREVGCTSQLPMCLVRDKNYGVKLEDFPQALKQEVLELLAYKTREYVPGRSKKARVANFLNEIPTESAADARDRMSARCVHFTVLEPIPFMIEAERLAAEKCLLRDRQRAENKTIDEKWLAAEAKATYEISLHAMNELLMKWILLLPMRQLNIRELSIGKNLFRNTFVTDP